MSGCDTALLFATVFGSASFFSPSKVLNKQMREKWQLDQVCGFLYAYTCVSWGWERCGSCFLSRIILLSMEITQLRFLAPEKTINNVQILETQTVVGKSCFQLPPQSKISLSNSFQITSRYLAGGTELAPNHIPDEALNQKLQDYKCFTSDKNPKAEGFAAFLSSSTVKTITWV